MWKKITAYILLATSIVLFMGLQFIHVSREGTSVSYYALMALRDTMRYQIQTAAVSGSYRSLALPMPSTVEQVCVVDTGKVDTSHFLCQLERLCSEWKNKEANVFFLPGGDSFLLEELVPSKSAECFPVIDKKLFFTLKQKDGRITIEQT